ncbi:Putative Putative AAA superfamily ATPases [Podospora comata]|uniref:Putative AAA superfamily ATPases n=1 Tax=Podospora comata TaxID=48703 RepID=A0ABY6S5G7_PODCO|nr:Putative Putative AAA superfamily ATPases [Podospora comata]
METDKHSLEVREGNPPAPANGEECKAPVEGTPKAAATDKKTGERVAGKPKDKKKTEKKSSKAKRKKKADALPSSDESATDDDTSESDSASDHDDSSSESESESKKKRVTKKRHEASRSKRKSRSKKSKKLVTSEESSSSSGESDSDASKAETEDCSEDEMSPREAVKQMHLLVAQAQQLAQQQQHLPLGVPLSSSQGMQFQRQNAMPYSFNPSRQYNNDDYDGGAPPSFNPPRSSRRGPRFGQTPGGRGNYGLGDLDAGLSNLLDPNLLGDGKRPTKDKKERKKQKKKEEAAKLNYKRVDQVWNSSIHNYKLQDTAEGSVDSQYHDFLFHVRRTFDWEGKYKATIVDIKSKLLRECLQDVMGNVKGVSLVESTPKLDPNLLFLYLDDLKTALKGLKRRTCKGAKRDLKKEQKRLEDKRKHLKVLIKYLEKDYAEVKKSLYPMLKNGLITFDLLWALWKPNTLAFAHTYSSPDEPRVFKVEIAEKHSSFMKGDYYYLEGKYFEYDGKQFGYGSVSEEIMEFRGARKITSLNCYPLSYHKNEARVREELVERGKKFVGLAGVYYKSHQGMAYYKKKKGVVKVNINGRIMVDPAIHRRINPNYPISMVRPKDHDRYSDDECSDESDCSGCGSDDEEEAFRRNARLYRPKRSGPPDNNTGEKLEKVSAQNDEVSEETKDGEEAENKEVPATGSKDAKKIPEFSEEDYLIASPVVLGFSFAEKLWLEFSVSGVKEIQWNETAYDSLVLESKTKDIVKALVESHKYHAAESIDDVIQGKGRGLVAVLHGPPGTGKTLTAEGISELLKCPLYMVSAGELGTDSRFLETELQKILDICHAWGAILLLDEADVFLEKRNMHDIHRNALVSIFLKQVEYVQNILILTTNRVETFDDAFQSRIHIALRYGNLEQKARKAIFKIFIDRVRAHEGSKLGPFTDSDYESLSRKELNGRQIKNTVRTAQALAVNKGEPLCMSHIRQVLEVQANFDRDLKGGTGYQDAMRSYF